MDKKTPVKDIAFSIIFLVWFIASIALLASLEDIELKLAVFGQYFLVFGIAGTVSAIKNKKLLVFLPLLVLPITGAGTVYFSLAHRFGWPFKEYGIMAIINLFTVIGFLLFLSALYQKGLIKKCTYQIQATCVEVDERMTRNRERNVMTYCPTYTIWFRDKEWRLKSDIYTNTHVPEVSKQYTIKINPDNPLIFTDEGTKKSCILIFVLGIIFMICGIATTVFLVSSGNVPKI